MINKNLHLLVGIFLCILFFPCPKLFAQTQQSISGSVKNEKGEGVLQVTLVLKHNQKPLSFTYSDAQGNFKFPALSSNVNLDSCFIETHHMSYEGQINSLQAGKWIYPFVLKTKENYLEAVEIGRPPITGRADTLRFDVAFFTQLGDKSIGDVLKNMPGIEVKDNGKISYMGQDISDFYIDGDDLFAGRYGLGTKVIPHEVINFVEVIRNHQRIKALENKVHSSDVAINLIVDEESKLSLSGEASLSAGFPDALQGQISVILFNDKIKTLQVLSGNNTGVFLGEDHEMLVDQKLGMERVNPYLRTARTDPTRFSFDDYYANRSGSLSSNIHFNLKNDWKARFNLLGYGDQLKYEQGNKSTILTSDEAFIFEEYGQGVVKPWRGLVESQVSKNVSNRFLSNTLSAEFKQTTASSDWTLHENQFQNPVFSQTKYNYWNLNNHFQFIPQPKGKNIWEFNVNLGSQRVPEKLSIKPEENLVFNYYVLPALIGAQQIVTFQNQFAAGNTRLVIGSSSIPWLKQQYSLEAYYGVKEVDSDLRGIQGIPGGDPFLTFPAPISIQNALKWKEFHTTARGIYYLDFERFNATIQLPVQFLTQNWRDDNYLQKEQLNRLYFMPRVSMNYQLTNRSSLNVNLLKSESVGQVWNVLRGEIMQDFRTLGSSQSSVPEVQTHVGMLRYSVENPGKMLFGSLGATISKTDLNTITNLILTPESQQFEAVNRRNSLVSQSYFVEVNQYLRSLNGKAGLNMRVSFAENQRLINGQLYRNLSENFSIMPTLNSVIAEKITLFYRGEWMWSSNQQPEINTVKQRNFSSENSLSLRYAIHSEWAVKASADHFYMFYTPVEFSRFTLNSELTYRPKESRWSYAVIAKNLTNQQNYQIKYQQNQTIYEEMKRLRGNVYQLQINWKF